MTWGLNDFIFDFEINKTVYISIGFLLDVVVVIDSWFAKNVDEGPLHFSQLFVEVLQVALHVHDVDCKEKRLVGVVEGFEPLFGFRAIGESGLVLRLRI